MSEGLVRTGYLSDQELERGPGVPSAARRGRGPVAVIECVQPIPCNPCESSCRVGAIHVGEDINNPPRLDEDKCVGCQSCLPICPGQAIFLVDESPADDRAAVTVPYEFLPLPEKGATVTALDRSGRPLGDASITAVRLTEKMDRTALVTMELPRSWAMRARAFRLKG
ncbi:MAG: 4Fe-4S binding protein [Thermodesulfobacteriota bacterium]